MLLPAQPTSAHALGKTIKEKTGLRAALALYKMDQAMRERLVERRSACIHLFKKGMTSLSSAVNLREVTINSQPVES